MTDKDRARHLRRQLARIERILILESRGEQCDEEREILVREAMAGMTREEVRRRLRRRRASG